MSFMSLTAMNISHSEIMSVIEESGLFDRNFYLDANLDVAASHVDPLEHYVTYGAFEGREPNPIFNSCYYLEQCPELGQTRINPLWHYITSGVFKGLNPNPYFDTSYYLTQYPDVAASGINPLKHYLSFGVREKRHPSSEFATFFDGKQYSDVLQPDAHPLERFLHNARHFREALKVRVEEALFTRMQEDYLQLRMIEPLLPPIDKLKLLVKIRHPKYSPLADAYFKLVSMIDQPFSHLYILSHLGDDGFSRSSLNFCSLVKENIAVPLILVTDQIKPHLSQNFLPKDKVIYLESLLPGLSANDKATIIVRLIVQTAPRVVHNFNCQACWLAFRDYHRQLNCYTQLAASLPAQELDADRIPTGHTIKFFNQCIDKLKWVFVDNDGFKKELINQFALEEHNCEKLIVDCQPAQFLSKSNEKQKFSKTVLSLNGYL